MQFVREFAKLGLTRSVGGVLGLALARELTPVVTSIILAGTSHSTICSHGMINTLPFSLSLVTSRASRQCIISRQLLLCTRSAYAAWLRPCTCAARCPNSWCVTL